MNREEEMMLREYAAGRACTQAVVDVLGPMSLWSQSAFEAELEKARAEERKASAEHYLALYRNASERREFELKILRERFDQLMTSFVQSQSNLPVKLMADGESFEAGRVMEREACAQICAQRAKDFQDLFEKYGNEADAGAKLAASQCEELIRARGQQ